MNLGSIALARQTLVLLDYRNHLQPLNVLVGHYRDQTGCERDVRVHESAHHFAVLITIFALIRVVGSLGRRIALACY